MTTERLKAAKDGKLHYDGKECPKCGSTQRYTKSGVCVVCTKAKIASDRAKIKALIQIANNKVSA